MRRRAHKVLEERSATLLLAGRIPMASLLQTLAVAQHLSFCHAAQALGISQSSVSARVKALEEELGVILFDRNTRGVQLTEAGRHFVERVTVGIDQLDHAIRTAGMVSRGECGRLRVGVHALIPGSFLAALIERYRAQQPGIVVEISEGTARDSVMLLRANKLDLTFVAGTPRFPDCHARPVWTERFLAALPSHHPLADKMGVAWADLVDDTFIVRRSGTGPQVQDHIMKRLAGDSPSLSILRFAVEHVTLLSMIAQGYGITIASEATELIHSPGVSFLPIIDEPESLPFSVIWSPHNHSPALKSILDLAKQMSRRV